MRISGQKLKRTFRLVTLALISASREGRPLVEDEDQHFSFSSENYRMRINGQNTGAFRLVTLVV